MSYPQTLRPGAIVAVDAGPIPLFVRWPTRAPRDVLICVHGKYRQALVHAIRFAELAERHDLLLIAPSFSRTAHPRFQRLARGADDKLIATLGAMLQALGVRSRRWLWFGHSAGAQFVHRLVFRHPGHVRRAALSAAGWYTMPDPDVAWPLGLRGLDRAAPLPSILRVPQRVFVGEMDVRRGDSLRSNAALDEQQGPHRLARARRFAAALDGLASQSGLPAAHSILELPGAAHDFAYNMRRCRLGQSALHFLLEDATEPSMAMEHLHDPSYSSPYEHALPRVSPKAVARSMRVSESSRFMQEL